MAYPYDNAVPLVPSSPLGPQMGQPQQPQDPGLGTNPETGLPWSREELAMLLGTYGDQMELSSLEKQQGMADALRGAEVPEGRSSGRVYTAANPLEVLGTIGKQYAGKRKQDRIDRLGKRYRGNISENIKTYGGGLFGGRATDTSGDKDTDELLGL